MEKFLQYASVQMLNRKKRSKRMLKMLIWAFVLITIILLLPWTQTITSKGNVTSLNQNNRPQTIQSVIGGRIIKWYVQEGQFVQKGDTIVHLAEVKSEYMDPNLIQRAESQMKAKESSANSYMSKVKSLDNQIDALIDSRIAKLAQATNKLKQGKLKVVSDSMDYQANVKQLEIAIKQYDRTEELTKQGLKSVTELENKRLKVQEMEAKVISLENKLLTSRNELINAKTELNSIDAEYRDKIAKSESEKSSALSGLFDTEATVTKMQNQVSNYAIRSGFYYVTAPQAGFISQALKNGVGETVKEGSPLVSIVPTLTDLAVEIFVEPIDLPLLHVGNKVRIQFDGWPAIVFSGWPNVSYGTYGGKVFAIDTTSVQTGNTECWLLPIQKITNGRKDFD
jgi:adhesin transport system membrane fusion protein